MLLMLNPYPAHYRRAFAFSLFLYRLPYQHASQRAFPRGRATGLPRSAVVP